jgi:protein-L-isoaspartate(D-aspartate) O-methyltransferase
MDRPHDAPSSAALRWRMVNEQLTSRGIRDPRVIAAFLGVARERFVAAELRHRAYEDGPLPIEEGQTISQPYVVAWMAESLELSPTARALEVGTGSGYGAAILAELAAEVVTIERLAPLAESARARLAELGYEHVLVVQGDGTLGYPARHPYDAIAVTAAGPTVPEALLAQLAPGGRLVMPVGSLFAQRLLRVRRVGARFVTEDLGGVVFVPLLGSQGFRVPELTAS